MTSFADRLASELTQGWWVTARSSQLPPEGHWSVWLLLAGRGFGKTRVLSEMANSWAASGQYRRLALVAATASDCRDVLVEGESGILSTAPDWCRPQYQTTRRRLEWPNGALAYMYSAEEPDRLRGPQHDAAICDELATWRSGAEAWDMLQFGLRLGKHPKTVIASTPRPVKLIRALLAREGQGVVVTRGTSYENAANLAPEFFASIVKRYEGTRLGPAGVACRATGGYAGRALDIGHARPRAPRSCAESGADRGSDRSRCQLERGLGRNRHYCCGEG